MSPAQFCPAEPTASPQGAEMHTRDPEMLSWETAELGAIQGRRLGHWWEECMCWTASPGVSSPAFRDPCGFPGTAPQKLSGMEIGWGHPQYPSQVEIKEILWRLSQRDMMID